MRTFVRAVARPRLTPQLRCALERGNLMNALSAARDLPTARWAARWSTELPGVDLAESQLVQAALASLGTKDGKAGGWTLLALSRRPPAPGR